MNEMVRKGVPALPLPRRAAMWRDDKSFLPAAIEIIETPASPAAIGLPLVIIALFCAALVWAYFGRIDIFASATGKVRPVGQVKTVAPLEAGRVRLLAVANGSVVKAGDVLLELDPTEVAADLAGVRAGLAGQRGEAMRRHAALATVAGDGPVPEAAPAVTWPADMPDTVRLREERVLRADLGALRASLASLDAQAGQRVAERDRLTGTIAAQANLLRTLHARVDIRNAAINLNVGTRTNLMDAMQALQAEETTLATNRGYLAETEATLTGLSAERTKLRRTFINDNAQKLAEVERTIDDTRQRLVKAEAVAEHRTLKSPIDGVVQSLSVTTLGQVVPAGQEVMRVVPAGAALEVEAYVENHDVAFVREGQEVIVKVDALPFTRYGTLHGRVVRVAHDSVPAPEATRGEGEPTRGGKSAQPGATDAIHDLVYPVTIRLDQDAVEADGERRVLTPGMSVSAELRTGSRRLIDYLFAPLAETHANALHER